MSALSDERPALIGGIVVSAITTMLYVNQPDSDGRIAGPDLNSLIVGLLVSVLFCGYVIGAIRLIRGKKKKLNTAPYVDMELTAWGYIWRYFVVVWVASFTFILAMFLPMNVLAGQILFSGIFLLSIPLIVLVLFGEKRIQKLRSFLAYINGFPKL